jgi:signal transduction histidine kinase
MLISYMAFSNARRSEQNKVWTGMAKETAHQIGTPLSALMGWLGYLKEQYPKENAFGEMEKDIDRLTDITDRFSKIGSQPERTDKDLDDTIEKTVDYLRSRLGNKITLSLDMDGSRASNHNQQLISWVLENMIKNSADAMDGSGTISVEKRTQSNRMIVLIKDTGRGITQADQRKIFEPGFTSKSRGWGLGLSLAKRIIEEYHGGKLTLEQSIPGEGTTFKISLPIA